MDRKKISIGFLISCALLFSAGVGVGLARDDQSSDEVDEDYTPPKWVSNLGGLFGGASEPIDLSDLEFTESQASWSGSELVIQDLPIEIKIPSSDEEVRSTTLVLVKAPVPRPVQASTENPDGDPASKTNSTPPELRVIEVRYVPNDGDIQAPKKAPLLHEPTDEEGGEVKLTVTEEGGTLTLLLASGSEDGPFTVDFKN